MVAGSSATVFRRYVALELLRLRQATALSREQVAAELGCSGSHIRHLETMFSLPKQLETKALLQLYDAAERTDDFLRLTDAARRGKDWWAELPGVPKWLDLLLGMEAAAATIHSYDAMVVPGLFQTPRYAEAVIRAGEPTLPEVELQPRIDLRMQRQDVLHRRPDPPAVWCLLDEAVLHRRTDNPDVLREQLDHLVKLARLPTVHIQVVPFTATGLHPGLDGTFTILTFGPELVNDPGVAYVQSRIRGTYYEDPTDIANYRDTWSHIQLHALNPDHTQTLLTHHAKEIKPRRTR